MARSVGHSSRTWRKDKPRRIVGHFLHTYARTQTRYYISLLLSHSVRIWCLGLTLMKKDPLLWRLNTLCASSSFDLPVAGSFILQGDAIPQRLEGTTVWQTKTQQQEQHCLCCGLEYLHSLNKTFKDGLRGRPCLDIYSWKPLSRRTLSHLVEALY